MVILDIFVTLIIGISASLLAGFFAHKRCNRRKKGRLNPHNIRQLEKQLPAFLEIISSNLGVGNSLQQSIEAASQKYSTDLGTFFQSVLRRVKSGMTLDDSLELQARALPGSSLSLALLSMASSYRSGSNVIEALALLATLCREREYLRKKILARTAQSRTQGYVLIFVPILFMLLLFVVSPHNMLPVLKTSTGRMLLLVAAALQCMGGITIHTMLKQDLI